MDNSIPFKLILIGGIKSCKTKFLEYLLGIINSNNINQYNGSMGAQYASKIINFFDKQIIFDFWDMTGNEQYDQLIRIFLTQCKFVFVFFDSSNKTSFQIFDFWDMAGNEQYDQLIRIFLLQCKFVFVFFDSSNKTSFQRAKTVFNIAKNVLNPSNICFNQC